MPAYREPQKKKFDLERKTVHKTTFSSMFGNLQKMKKNGDHRPRTVHNTSESLSFNYAQGKTDTVKPTVTTKFVSVSVLPCA